MNARFGFIMFATFYVTFLVVAIIAIFQGNPIAAIGGATLAWLAGESMSRCRQP